jgi:hypothetical protein
MNACLTESFARILPAARTRPEGVAVRWGGQAKQAPRAAVPALPANSRPLIPCSVYRENDLERIDSEVPADRRRGSRISHVMRIHKNSLKEQSCVNNAQTAVPFRLRQGSGFFLNLSSHKAKLESWDLR